MNTSESGRLCVILCTERSGSTLLSVLLGGHPRVVAPPETHLFRWADQHHGIPAVRDPGR